MKIDFRGLNYERNNIGKLLIGMDFVDTGKLNENMSYDQFTTAVEGLKQNYQKRGFEIGDLVPNANANDPLTLGINHIINTTNHKNNEMWLTHIDFPELNSSARIYVLFSDRAINGYYFRGLMFVDAIMEDLF